ncbi:MAG: hypothetical protein WBI07_18205 [Mobilitalea sp.]
MNDNKYGEVKTRRNIFPKDAREIADKGTVGILISQCSVSDKTKAVLSEGNITLYENVEPSEVDQIRETVKEKLKEKQENEKGE